MSAGQTPPAGPAQDGTRRDQPQNIATAIADISERATLLIREEIELAKAEVAEKSTKLARGAAVGAAAGVFFAMAFLFALIGGACLLYFYLPVGNDFTYFWGFFAMAADPRAGRDPGRCDRRESPQTRLAAGADDGDRRGAQNPRDRRSARARAGFAAPSIRRARVRRPGRAGRTRDDGPRRRHAGGRGLMAQRTPAEIRNSIESNRMELAVSVQQLRGEVERLTDWRRHVERHRSEPCSARPPSAC